MSKKDQEILELLKQKVLDRDKELERKEYHSATKEALAEMTNLSNEEVDALYREIRLEKEREEKKKRKIMIISAVAAVVILLFFLPTILRQFKDPAVFVEDFNDNENAWNLADKMGSGRTLENGKYVMDIHKKPSKIEYIDHVVDLPENFSLEVDVKKISGSAESLGFYIGEDSNNFGYFFFRSNGKFRWGFSVKGDWMDNPDWRVHDAVKTGTNVLNHLKVIVKGNNFEYYINEQKVDEGSMFGLNSTQYSLAVGGTQLVEYDNLKITNLENNEIVFENTFDQEIKPWTEKTSIIKKSEFVDDSYKITVNYEGYCYWASTWMPEEIHKADEFEINLDIRELRREGDGHCGFMFLSDDDNYIVFDVFNGSQARIQVVVDDDFKYEGTYYGDPRDQRKKNRITVKKNEKYIEFYFNGNLADKIREGDWLYWDDLEKMGLRVCNFQTIAFDHLEMKEIL